MKSLFTGLVVVAAFSLFAIGAHAQTQPDTSSPPPPQAQAPSDTPADQSPKLSQAELDQLVAPIALYPDPLLSEVLMASTYPLEVVEASRWVEANKSLKGSELKAAADKQSWDDSVKELTATPSVLAMMSDKLDWMEKLGDAVLAQQPDVMDSVQRLRARAQAQDQLKTNKEQKVSSRTEQNRQIIAIEPAEPDTIYVPYYNPSVVYGAWPYPDYPAYYWPPPIGYYGADALAAGIAFTAGFAVGAWATNDYWWGGGFGWDRRDIYVNRRWNDRDHRRWSHNADHRRGVSYKNRDVANRYDRNRGNRDSSRANLRERERGQPPRASDRAGNRDNRQNAVADRDRKKNAGNRDTAKRSAQNRGGSKKQVQRAGASQKRAAHRPSSRSNNVRVNRGGQARAHANVGRSNFSAHRGGGGRAARGGGGGGRRR